MRQKKFGVLRKRLRKTPLKEFGEASIHNKSLLVSKNNLEDSYSIVVQGHGFPYVFLVPVSSATDILMRGLLTGDALILAFMVSGLFDI